MSHQTIDSPATLQDWVFPWPAFNVDFRRSALLVIDYQNYSVNRACGLMRRMIELHPAIADYYVPWVTEVAIPNTRRLLDAFRAQRWEVVYTRNGGLLPGGRDLIERRRQRDVDAQNATGTATLWSRGSYEHEVIDELAPQPNELIIDKNCSSPFNGTGIDQLLRNLEIRSLFVTGMATDMCVETTARDAADRGFDVVVVEDAVATFVEDHHRAALSALARVYTQVWTTGQVLAALLGAAAAG
jgi:biuret amidohydrolase